jgi:hypothetical protein
MKPSFHLALALLALPCGADLVAGDLAVVRDRQPGCVIYHRADAPASVKTAAAELRRAVRIATGAELPIRTEPSPPMIALGDTDAARAAGLEGSKMPDESFRILSQGGNLLIVGNDWPDDGKKWVGCDSTGTLFGVYEFLERVLHARWFMPGALGEDIPAAPKGLVVRPMDVTQGPAVAGRNLEFGGAQRNDPLVREWLQRNRLGRSIYPSAGHNFSDHPPTSVLLAHPEYMPLQADGTREKPVGNRAWGSHEHKFCLSNPGLVGAFADSLNATIAKNPQRHGASASPADGGIWCRCAGCQALKREGPNPKWENYAPYGYSMTPLVLRFYNGVARRVGAVHPQHVVAGLLYHDYLYPPDEPGAIEPNLHFTLALANRGYGFKFYKPENEALVKRLITGWAAVAPSLGWTDYSTWMRNCMGAPLPPGIPILKTTFGGFGKKLRDVNYCPQGGWGISAAHNWLVARLLWNNEADVDALYGEFLRRFYGPAGEDVRRIHSTVEDALRAYIIAKKNPDHEIWYDTAEAVWAPIFPEIERRYARALQRPCSEIQKRRLEMFGDNLVRAHWNLRHAGLLREPEKSIFHRADADYERFEQEKGASLAMEDLSFFAKWRWQTMIWSPEKRSVEARPLPEGVPPPKLDGDLSDAAWKTAGVADAFRRNEQRRELSKWRTTVRVAHDAERLYLAFECLEEDTGKLRAECAIRNSDGIFKDDVVEFAIQPGGGASVEFAANPANTVRFRGRTGEGTGIASAVAKGQGRWVVEVAVPFRDFGLEGVPRNTTWRGNFSRRRVGPPIECSSWSRVEERLSDPRAFGEIKFGE